MANESLIVGNSNWAVKANNLLGYAVGETSGYYVPRELNFTRNSTATYTDENGIIQTAAANIARVQDNALLLEPQRTNVVLQSGDLSQSVWSKPNYTLSSATVIQGLTATRITKNATNNGVYQGTGGRNVLNSVGTFVAGTKAFSVLLRKGNTEKVGLLINNILVGAFTAISCEFDFSTETFTNVPSGLTATFEKPTTDVYRLILVFNDTGTSTAKTIWIAPIDSSNNTVTDGYVDVAYFQWEAGAYATSYIPTTSATVTRLADTCSKTGISSLIGQTEGVLYWEGVVLNQTDILAINRSTANGIYITKGSGNLYRAAIYNSSSVIQFADVGVKTTTTKIAIAYKSGDSALFVNGSKIGATNTSTITFSDALSELRLNDNYLISTAPQFTNKINIYNTRLSDSDCISLTTL